MLLSKGGLVGSTDRALIRSSAATRRRSAPRGADGALRLHPRPAVHAVHDRRRLPRGRGLALAGDQAARRRRPRPPPAAAAPAKKSLGDLLDVDEIHMEFAPNLVPVVMDEATGLDARIVNMRNHIATEFGLILPEIRLTDNPGLPPGTYAIRIQGVEVARSAHRDRPGAGAPARRGRRGARGPHGRRAGLRRAGALDRARAAGAGGADGPVGRHADRGRGDAPARDGQGELRAALHPALAAQAARRVRRA